MRTRRRFTADFKAKVALEALRGDRTIQEIAGRHKVHPNQVSVWKRQAVDGLDAVFSNGAEKVERGSGGRDPRPARQDRPADGGAGFFGTRAQTMSRSARRAMVRRNDPALSLSRQCSILSISRSSLYYRPKGESAESLALMRRIDELYLKYPFYGSRQMARQLGREGHPVGRHRVRRLMRPMGLQAIHQPPRTSAAHPEHRIYP